MVKEPVIRQIGPDQRIDTGLQIILGSTPSTLEDLKLKIKVLIGPKG